MIRESAAPLAQEPSLPAAGLEWVTRAMTRLVSLLRPHPAPRVASVMAKHGDASAGRHAGKSGTVDGAAKSLCGNCFHRGKYVDCALPRTIRVREPGIVTSLRPTGPRKRVPPTPRSVSGRASMDKQATFPAGGKSMRPSWKVSGALITLTVLAVFSRPSFGRRLVGGARRDRRHD